MNIEMIRFIHLFISVSFLGFQVAGYYYLVTSLKQNNLSLIRYTIKNILYMDAFSLIIILGIFISCASMVMRLPDFSFAIPWVMAACIFLSLVTFFFFFNLVIKVINLKRIKQACYKKFTYIVWLHINYSLIILMLILIIRDAVMKSTFL
jgi:hypothetical protein